MERRRTRPGEEPRASLEQAVGLRFKHFDDFIDELAANISTGGMFIRTRRPHPVGSVFEFELRLGNDRPLIAGKAQVAWVRRRSEYLDKPVGMGVRFVELDDTSRRHIAELVADDEQDGGQPGRFEEPEEGEIEDKRTDSDQPTPPLPAPPAGENAPPPEASAASSPEAVSAETSETTAGTEPPVAAPARPPAERETSDRRESRSARLPWILLMLLLAVVAALLWREPSLWVPAAENRVAENGAAENGVAENGAPIEPAPAAEPSATAGAALVTAPEQSAERPDQMRLVNEWARAWSEQRVDDYLEAYSPRFRPTGGLDRSTWERQRRARILAPQWIQVRLAFVELEEAGTDRSRLRFVQAYESDSYRDVVRKVLELERGASGWRILQETVEP